MHINIYNRNEFFNIPVDQIIYIKAEDHYTSVYYLNGTRVLISIGLTRFCKILSESIDFDSLFITAGRSYVISVSHINFINIPKEIMAFNSTVGKLFTISMPKTRLRILTDELKKRSGVKYEMKE